MWRRGYAWQLQSLPTFVVAIMAVYVYLAVTFTIPLCSTVFSAHWVAAMDSLALFNAAMTLLTYMYAVTLDAGAVPPKWFQARHDHSVREKPLAVNLCIHCNEYKPHRTHHCSHCKRCVLRYDHHCDWIDNCVGLANHKFFFLFQFYISCAIIHHFYLLGTLLSSDIYFMPIGVSRGVWAYRVGNIIVLAIYTLLIVPLSFFGVLFSVWTAYLLVNNMTSLDSETGQAYDEGLVTNLKMVMGTRVLHWFLPLRVEIDYTKLDLPRDTRRDSLV